MASLSEVMERIMNWLQKNRPERVETFQPGLSREEIDHLIGSLPIQITEELYEIYQWRNGSTDWNGTDSLVSPILEFMPLEEAINSFYDLFNLFTETPLLDESFSYDERQLFPIICENSSCYYAVMVDNKERMISPVMDVDSEGDLSIVFNSLTDMMQTLAEYCETGTYYIDAEGFLATR